MLVCNVSMGPRRTVAVELAETVAATDAPASASNVFDVLVDDPAAAVDFFNTYIGDDVVEAASATDTFGASIPATFAADVVESMTASSTQDASIAAGVVPITWDAATIANVTLSGGNLVVTSSGTAGETGARGPASAGKTTGKYYFEITLTTDAGGGNTGFGVGTTASTYTAMGNNATSGSMCYVNGAIYSNSTNTGRALQNPGNGVVIGIAIDLDNRKAWFRNWMPTSPGASDDGWNGQLSTASQNPVTNTGGVTIPAGTIVPFCACNASGNVFTANFGASTFTGAVPSGFTSGWPA